MIITICNIYDTIGLKNPRSKIYAIYATDDLHTPPRGFKRKSMKWMN